MAKQKKQSTHSKAASRDAAAILALSPFVIGTRLLDMSSLSPVSAMFELHSFGTEKMMTASASAFAVASEMTRQSLALAAGGKHDAESSADRLTAAALKHVANKVRANARAKPKK